MSVPNYLGIVPGLGPLAFKSAVEAPAMPLLAALGLFLHIGYIVPLALVAGQQQEVTVWCRRDYLDNIIHRHWDTSKEYLA